MTSPSVNYRTPKQLIEVLLDAIRDLDEKIDRQDEQITALNERLDKLDADFLKENFQDLRDEIRALDSSVAQSVEDYGREVQEFRDCVLGQLQEAQEETLRVERQQWRSELRAARHTPVLMPGEYAF